MFDYHLAAPRRGEYPFTPFARIVLDGYFCSRDGRPELSAQLMTDTEIDWCVQQLKRELDKVGRRAKNARKRAVDELLRARQDSSPS
ncbi:MAG: hypothetical protein OXU70_10565 [Gammaproteobacteria bacterium]|nr:hypothetical protein [Gammaproteobacteria bacterium]